MSEKLLAEWFWIDRWVGSSAFGLPQEARGVYREMLTQAWRRGARLPNDHDQIRRLTATTLAEWKRAWPLVERFWRVEGPDLVNDTQLLIYAEAMRRSSTTTERAKVAADARWRKHQPSNAQASTQASAQAHARALLGQSPLSLSQSPTSFERPSVSLSQRARARVISEPELAERAGNLLEHYAEWYSVHRHGARLKLIRNSLEFQDALELCRLWDDQRLEKLAGIVLTTDDPYISGTDRAFKIFALKATWADDVLSEWERKQARQK